MENLVTPSERAQSLINPHSRNRTNGHSPQDKVILALKIILGTPIPVLLILYVCGLVISESFLAMIAGLTCTLTFLYILVDRFSKQHEFQYFFNATDLPMLGFLFICAFRAVIAWDNPGDPVGVIELTWVLAYFLLSYGFFLFPGLNRLFQAFGVFVPLVCLFVIWQKFYGLKINLSILPDSMARAVSGIDTVFFDSVSPFAMPWALFISFGTAALLFIRPGQRLLNLASSQLLRLLGSA